MLYPTKVIENITIGYFDWHCTDEDGNSKLLTNVIRVCVDFGDLGVYDYVYKKDFPINAILDNMIKLKKKGEENARRKKEDGNKS